MLIKDMHYRVLKVMSSIFRVNNVYHVHIGCCMHNSLVAWCFPIVFTIIPVKRIYVSGFQGHVINQSVQRCSDIPGKSLSFSAILKCLVFCLSWLFHP